MTQRLQTFLSYAFRPFFLLNGLFAVVVVLIWMLLLHGVWLKGPPSPILWHAHEMLVGFAMATIAGFILTAVATWTGRAPLRGAPLGWLVIAWLCGRIGMAASGVIPPWLAALIDFAFPVLLCIFVAREVLAAGNRRNYPIVAIIGVLALLNIVYHLDGIGAWPNAGLSAAGWMLAFAAFSLVYWPYLIRPRVG